MKLFYLIPYFLLLSCFTASAQCWKTIAAGPVHTIAIKNDGTIWGWGYNYYGQLGDGTDIPQNIPTQIGTANNWKTVSTGMNHALAIKEDGTLWAWGSGLLGDGINYTKSVPIQIGTATNWKAVGAGRNFSLALKQDGSIWSCGLNSLGQLGDGTNATKNSFTQIGNATNWQSISTGDEFSVAIKQDNTIWAWGSNYSGQIGDGTNANRNIPTQIGTANNWQTVVCGKSHVVATKLNGTLWAWGINGQAQLGNGTTNDTNAPIQVGFATHWSAVIAAGSLSSYAVTQNGFLWAWGGNGQGQLGNGANTNQTTPVQIGNANNWQKIDAGEYHLVSVNVNNELLIWGNNSYGQLGNGTYISQNTPMQLGVCNNTLPVQILSFTGKSNNGFNLLHWTTVNENNNRHFEIERSNNAIHFNAIGTLPSLNNVGSTTNYNFTDLHPANSIHYYRLKQVDNNNKFTFSSIISINNKSEKNIKIYPNPAINSLFLSEQSENTNYTILNTIGQIVQAGKYVACQPIKLNQLKSGIYFIKINKTLLRFIKE